MTRKHTYNTLIKHLNTLITHVTHLSGLALAGHQVADGYYSYHPAINFFFF